MTRKFTPTGELTEKRKTLLKVIASDLSEEEFPRSGLNAHLYYNDVGHLIDEDDDEDKATIQTTTSLLNKIVEEDGYLQKTQQGGGTGFVLDDEADEEEDEIVTAVTPDEIAKMVNQVAKRHGVTINIPEEDLPKWTKVTKTVNRTVGHEVLRIASAPNKYKIRKEGQELIEDNLL